MSRTHRFDPPWTSAYGDVKIQWEEHAIGFDCACGAKEMQLSDDTNEVTCPGCGRQYWLGVYFRMREPQAEEAL